jgi:hypothetical protein
MLNHGVQRPPERTLTSVCIQVPDGVEAFQEGVRVSNLVAVAWAFEVSVPWVRPGESRTEPSLDNTPSSLPAASSVRVSWPSKSM